MATERLLQEVKTNDLPKIDLGNFAIRPVDRVFQRQAGPPAANGPNGANGANGVNGAKVEPKSIAQQFINATDADAAPALSNAEFPLNLLENKTFAGTGYNTIWRPRSKDPIKPVVAGSEDDVLELNLTAETMAFSKSLGDVPNRGVTDQKDLTLKGISYVQRVGAFENPDTGSNDSPNPVGIHFEPGLFMFVPQSDNNPKGQPATINRMASVPHGTTVNAQGVAPSSTQRAGQPNLDKDVESIIPFDIKAPHTSRAGFPHLDFDSKDQGSQDNRLPTPLSKFDKTITKKIFRDPNQVLRNAIADQNIESFAKFEISTKSSPDNKIVGGGTSNIGFLQGTDKIELAGSGLGRTKDAVGNAHAATMKVTYWIETLSRTISIEPKTSQDQVFPTKASAAGVLGPTFVVSAAESAKLSARTDKKVTWTQIQYSQNVSLNFNTLTWPHISVATLGDTSTINIKV